MGQIPSTLSLKISCYIVLSSASLIRAMSDFIVLVDHFKHILFTVMHTNCSKRHSYKGTSFAISWVIVRCTLTAIILHNNGQGHNIMFHPYSWSRMISRSSYRLFDIVQVALAKCCSKRELGLCYKLWKSKFTIEQSHYIHFFRDLYTHYKIIYI